MPFLFALLLAAAPCSTGVRTVCGVRDGTAGNASLVSGGREVIELARQGGAQRLLKQADALTGPDAHGERGTQNGARYGLIVGFDRCGALSRVLRARRVR